jgi:putative spermidine/putrescine transport system permease protein
MRADAAAFSIATGAARTLGLLVFLFMLVPILAILPLSFTSGVELVYPLPSFSLRWYVDFFTRPEWLSSIRNSLIVGSGATAIATVLGVFAALGMTRLPRKTSNVVAVLMVLPMAVPVVIVAVAIYFFFASIGLTGTFAGLILAHSVLALPFVVISVRASLTGLDPHLAHAAASLGAPSSRVLLRVIAPLILPGIATGALFAFAVSLDDVVVAMFVSGPGQLTLPRQMFNGVRENISPTILAAATLLVILSSLLMIATTRLAASSRAKSAPAL